MTTLATLVVKLVGDVSAFEKAMNASTKKAREWGDNVSKIGQRMTVRFTTPLALAGVAAVKFASDLAESMNKAQVVFGDSAQAVIDFSSTAATNLGMSQQAALEAASTFGNLFTTMGLSQDASAKMSTGLVKLASDLASFNNLDPSEVLEKLRSGLVGEVEPLRALGINLNEATVKAQAMAMGLADTEKALTPAALAQARYALILQQTQNAQGDFARTSDGLANQTRILKAEVADLAAKFGTALIPFVQKAAGEAIKLLDSFNKLGPSTQTTIIAIVGLTAAAGPAMIAIGNITKAVQGMFAVMAIAGGPISMIVAGLAALGAAIGIAIQDWQEYKQVTQGTGRTATETMNTLAEAAGMMSLHTGKIHENNEAWKRLEAKMTTVPPVIDLTIQAQKELTDKTIEASKAAVLQASLAGNLSKSYSSYKQNLNELYKEQDKLLSQLKNLGGEGWTATADDVTRLSTAYVSYEDKLKKLGKNHEQLTRELTKQLEELNINGWYPSTKAVEELANKLRDQNKAWTEETAAKQAVQILLADHKKQIDNVSKALVENQKAQDAANEAMKRATAEMIYQQAAAGLDAQASLDLARKMGLISEQDYAVSTTIQNIRTQYDLMDGSLDGVIKNTQGFNNAILNVSNVAQALQQANIPLTIDNIQKALTNGMSAFTSVLDPGSTGWAIIQQETQGVAQKLATTASSPFDDMVKKAQSTGTDVTKAMNDMTTFVSTEVPKGFNTFGTAIDEKALKKLEGLANQINIFTMPALRTVNGFVAVTMVASFGSLANAIQEVTNKLSAMAAKLRNLNIPAEFVPGSPTPFENGLRGIYDALDQINRMEMPSIMSASAGSGGGGVTMNQYVYTNAQTSDVVSDFQRARALAY